MQKHKNLLAMLDIALTKHIHQQEMLKPKTNLVIEENFECNDICTKSNERTSLFESEEIKNILLIFALILFYGLLF